MQLGDRVCSVFSYSFGDRFNHVFSVDQVEAGALVQRGNCDDNGSGPACADPDSDDADAHWDSAMSEDVAQMRAELQTPNEGALAASDPEFWHMLGLYPEDWFQTCLTTGDYPPKDLTWAGLGPKP